MKTLVFYGSPHSNSHTKVLLDAMLEELHGEVKIVDCYKANIAPCKDCKYCFHKKGCSIKMRCRRCMHTSKSVMQ